MFFTLEKGGNIMRRFFLSVALLPLIAGVASADFFGTGAGNDFVDNTTVSSSINVSGTSGDIVDISVTINNMNHTWLGDLTAVLDNGSTSVTLFARPGQLNGAGFGFMVETSGDFTFSANGTDSLWTEAGNSGGALNGTPFNFFTSGLNDVPTSLSDFFGQSKNGLWTLSISDGAGGDTGSYSGWTLDITSSGVVIPEPTTFGLIAGLAALTVVRRRR